MGHPREAFPIEKFYFTSVGSGQVFFTDSHTEDADTATVPCLAGARQRSGFGGSDAGVAAAPNRETNG